MSDQEVTRVRQMERRRDVRPIAPPSLHFRDFVDILVWLQKTITNEPITMDLLAKNPAVSPSLADNFLRALRFFDLVNVAGQASSSLLDLLTLAPDGAAWRTALEHIVRHGYASLFLNPELDLARASERDLAAAMKDLLPLNKEPLRYVKFFRYACRATRIPIRMTAREQRESDAWGESLIQEALNKAERCDDPTPDPDVVDPTPDPDDDDLQEDPMPTVPSAPVPSPDAAAWSNLKVVIADVCLMLHDPANGPAVIEKLRSVMPGPERLPPLPPYNPSWTPECQRQWFELYALKLKAELGVKA